MNKLQISLNLKSCMKKGTWERPCAPVSSPKAHSDKGSGVEPKSGSPSLLAGQRLGSTMGLPLLQNQ